MSKPLATALPPPDWPSCTVRECIGVRVDGQDTCLAHSDAEVHKRYLAGLQPIASVDLRGTAISTALLKRILRATTTGVGPSMLGNVHFDRAQFTGDARFDRAQFTGEAWFEGAQFTGEARFQEAKFSGDAGFDWAQFAGEAQFQEVKFTGDTVFDEAQFSRVARFDRAQVKHARFDGVQFDGNAWFEGTQFAGDVEFETAQFDGNAWFSRARFEGTARFSRVGFHGIARFDDARFSKEAGFSGARFSQDAGFNDARFSQVAWFNDAQFSRGTSFKQAQFIGEARFDRAQFTGETRFDRAQFTQEARFDRAQFTQDVAFEKVQFIRDARFGGARFMNGWFTEAEFSGDAGFIGAQFTGFAVFDGARFSQTANFNAMQVNYSRFVGAQFSQAGQLGPLVAATELLLNYARFDAPVVIAVATSRLSCVATTFQQSATLRVRYAEIVLDAAVFASPSTLADAEGTTSRPARLSTAEFNETSLQVTARPARPRLLSMVGSDVAHLTLAVDLRACRFAGAYHLDQLGIEGRDQFSESPSHWHWAWTWPPLWQWTSRRLLQSLVEWCDTQRESPAWPRNESNSSDSPRTRPTPCSAAAASSSNDMQARLASSTSSQACWSASQAAIARLRWAGRLSHTRVTEAPPSSRSSAPTTPMSWSVS